MEITHSFVDILQVIRTNMSVCIEILLVMGMLLYIEIFYIHDVLFF